MTGNPGARTAIYARVSTTKLMEERGLQVRKIVEGVVRAFEPSVRCPVCGRLVGTMFFARSPVSRLRANLRAHLRKWHPGIEAGPLVELVLGAIE